MAFASEAAAAGGSCPATEAQKTAPETATSVDGWTFSELGPVEPLPDGAFEKVQHGSHGLCGYRRAVTATQGTERRRSWFSVTCEPGGPDGCPMRWAERLQLGPAIAPAEIERAPRASAGEVNDVAPVAAPPEPRVDGAPAAQFPPAVFRAFLQKPVHLRTADAAIAGVLIAMEGDQLFVQLESGEVVSLSRSAVTGVSAGVVTTPAPAAAGPAPSAPPAPPEDASPAADFGFTDPPPEPHERRLADDADDADDAADAYEEEYEEEVDEAELRERLAKFQAQRASLGTGSDWTLGLCGVPTSLCGAFLWWGSFAGHDDNLAFTGCFLGLCSACGIAACSGFQIARKSLEGWSLDAKVKKLERQLALADEVPLEEEVPLEDEVPLGVRLALDAPDATGRMAF